jgi:hypothetical protein
MRKLLLLGLGLAWAASAVGPAGASTARVVLAEDFTATW